MLKIKPGDIAMVDLGSPTGHAQAFVRPAVVLCPVANTCVVLPLTSNPNAARFKHTMRLTATKQNGLASLLLFL